MTIKGNTRDPRGLGNILYLDCISVIISVSWLWYRTTVLQDVIIGRNRVKSTQDLSVLYLTIACESTIICK